MFTTPEQVKRLTKYDVTLEDIYLAQGIIESVMGRVEARIDDADDLERLARATAYQAVYIKSDPNNVFEQANMRSISQDTATNTFNTEKDSPFVAPMAEIAMRSLSWKRSRSITVGSLAGKFRGRDWKRY